MKNSVTVIAADKIVVVNGEALQFNFSIAENIHAIQWKEGHGHIEFIDASIKNILDYTQEVAPFVTYWEAEKSRIEVEKNKPLSLLEAQQAQLSIINATYSQLVSIAKKGIPLDEIYTWDIQKNEAEAWQLDATALTPFVDGIAQGRNMPREELLEKILFKVAAYRELSSVATGIRQGLEDAVLTVQHEDYSTEAEAVIAIQGIVWPK